MMHVASITGIAIDLTHENIPIIHQLQARTQAHEYTLDLRT
jgi:hypothetical protein